MRLPDRPADLLAIGWFLGAASFALFEVLCFWVSAP